MIFQMIKKQALLFLRNPVELLLLLGLPVILITILGNALGGFMDGGEVDLTFKMAVIEKENEKEQINRFIGDLESSDLPEEVVQELTTQATSITPVQTLLDVFQSEELADIIMLEKGTKDKLSEWTKDDSYAAIVQFPEDFTYQLLKNLFFEQESEPEVVIYHQEGATIAGNVVEQIITAYQEEYTRSSFLGKSGINPETFYALPQEIEQEITSISPHHPVTAMTYYAIGMVVMNVLFMGSTIAEYAYREKELHVFNRMLLANISHWTYFFSTLLTGMLFALLQMLIVFGFSYLVFGVTWPDIGAFLITTLFFALAVGGLAVLLTSISFRANSTQIISFFSGIVVTLFAFIGGSFFPIGDSSSFIQTLGDFTPNGAAMSAYLSIIRGESIAESMDHLIFLGSFAVAAIIIGVLSFPKRGVSS
jgi:ABC-2 type transport system permease protein